jgi:hypothetical protein
MRARFQWFLLIGIPLVCLIGVALYYLPPIHERLAWRIDDLRARIRYVLNPPEKVEFASENKGTPVARATPPTPRPSPTLTASPTPTPTRPEDTPVPTATPTLTPTPLPAALNLKSDTFHYFDQHGLYNYCAPANLAMALSFWGWKGDRTNVGNIVKPYPKDLNVMPYELADFAQENAGLGAMVRVGGDDELVKRFLNAGFPVLAEKGVHFRDLAGEVTWMGHYAVVTGYDDGQGVFITQDSYITPGTDYPVPYADFNTQWRSFNYTYLVIYPKDRENEVMTVLGPQADETYNDQYAAQIASNEIYLSLPDIERFFAWYNYGTNLVRLQDYGGAAKAYDEAFAIYNTLPEDKSVRPYRILWYQTGPYFAYYYTARYQTVIDLATTTLKSVYYDDTAPEESLYWRGMARLALGDTEGAIEDFRLSIKPYHPGFGPSLEQLQLMGVEP